VTLRQSFLAGIIFCLLACTALAGCAKRGPLEAPSAVADEQNQANGSNTANRNQKPEDNSQFPSPFKKQTSYPLDPLLDRP
jgi:predicted small lipoprotein YifL